MTSADPDALQGRLRGLAVFPDEMPAFDTDVAPEHPAELFLSWLAAAIDDGVRGPHAMTLSTVDADARPSSRVLILKGVDDGRWQFATSRGSRKGAELRANPWAAAVFHWPELGRQVRLRGRVLDAGPEAAARDFLARPPGSRAESMSGNQSRTLDRPDDLDAAFDDAQARLEAEPGLVPDHWVLYQLVPDEVEFWQGDRDRRHIRLLYELEDSRWARRRLWP